MTNPTIYDIIITVNEREVNKMIMTTYIVIASGNREYFDNPRDAIKRSNEWRSAGYNTKIERFDINTIGGEVNITRIA